MKRLKQLTRERVAAVGVLALAPLANAVAFGLSLSGAILSGRSGSFGSEAFRAVLAMFPVTLAMAFACVICMLADLHANPYILRREKPVWAFALLLLTLLAVPAYWWKHVLTPWRVLGARSGKGREPRQL